jgi:hypothetical protein
MHEVDMGFDVLRRPIEDLSVPLPFGACIMSMYFIALAPFQAT